MAHLKTLFLISLLFAVVLLISSKASARNDPGVAQTQGGAQVDRWHRGGGGGGHCHHPHCKEGAGGDETHQAETESTDTDEHGDKHKPYKPKPKHCKHWPHC
ncbi:endoribonuclease YSH1-like [Abeliophyllum distichum]|uniref:Endoribonuclease YSH1-like n=1 Tax=Abeliophyllum distichum TaxID=126358 RepID=A0ABD1QM99_9LAMI